MGTIARSLFILIRVLHRIIGFAGLLATLIILNARHGARTGTVTRGDNP
jgi:hypothetical protein